MVEVGKMKESGKELPSFFCVECGIAESVFLLHIVVVERQDTTFCL